MANRQLKVDIAALAVHKFKKVSATPAALVEEYFTVQACKGLQSECAHLFWTEEQGVPLDGLARGEVRWGVGRRGSSCQCPLSRVQVHSGGLAN